MRDFLLLPWLFAGLSCASAGVCLAQEKGSPSVMKESPERPECTGCMVSDSIDPDRRGWDCPQDLRGSGLDVPSVPVRKCPDGHIRGNLFRRE